MVGPRILAHLVIKPVGLGAVRKPGVIQAASRLCALIYRSDTITIAPPPWTADSNPSA